MTMTSHLPTHGTIHREGVEEVGEDEKTMFLYSIRKKKKGFMIYILILDLSMSDLFV